MTEKKRIEKIKTDLSNLESTLEIKEKRAKIEQLQLAMSHPKFWNNQKEARSVVAQLKVLKEDVDEWGHLSQRLKDIAELATLLSQDEHDDEVSKEVSQIEGELEKFKLKITFSGKFDSSSAILEINAGAGGTEACDWAGMLFRMYVRWAENKKFKVKVFDELRGEEAGIKNVTFLIEGTRAYGLLKAEKGVHRLVRISPFDSNKRRHTSFASVNAIPEIAQEIDVEMSPDDLRIDTFRASGCGGQHVNVTDSAVRITHLPTGLVASCQNERSQHQNKQVALQLLKANLYERKEEEKRKELEKIEGTKRKIEWGSQIRSYVLHPYLMVKDHRTNHETSNAPAVLDGDIDAFIKKYLEMRLKDDKKNSSQ